MKRQTQKNVNYSQSYHPSNNLTKAFSFKDPMFQSFGNNFSKSLEEKQLGRRNIKDEAFQNQIQQITELSERLSLLDTLFKIPIKVQQSSLLFVNSKNKMKTDIIIQMYRQKFDQDSKILCQNAEKYLMFLNQLNQLQETSQFLLKTKIPLQKSLQEQTTTDKKIEFQNNLNYRLAFNKEINYQSQQNRKNASKLNKGQFSNNMKTHEKQRFQDSKYEHKYFYTYEKSNHQLGLNLQHQLQETTDQMFKRIQTPKLSSESSINSPVQSFSIISRKSNNKGEKTIQKKDHLSSDKNRTIEFRKFQKLGTFQNSRSNNKLRQNSVSSNKMNIKQIKSKSKKSQNQHPINKQKSSNKYIQNKRKKINIQKEIFSAQKNNSLAIKVVNQTNQFEKMLKMTSSGIHEHFN